MKLKNLVLLQLLCCVAFVSADAKLGGKDKILQTGLSAVNKWLQGNVLDCNWQDGTFMIGLSILQRETQDIALHRAMLSYGEKLNWSLCSKLEGGAETADNQVCAATYAELYLRSPASSRAPVWINATLAQLDSEIRNATSVRNWDWVDALFMSMSVYARVGALTGKQEYFDKMHQNFVYTALTPHPLGYEFWSKTDHLFYRNPPKGNPDGVFWARGNGWAAAALVQALQFSPVGDPHRLTYRRVLKLHMERLVQLQGSDGCWRSSLTHPEFYDVPETTSTALFTYAMAYGISAGILRRAKYLPVVESAWGCLTSVSLHPDGTIGNCQPVGHSPRPDFGSNSTSSFCVGQFAMAAAAVAQLVQ